jgi:hypothetical protein
MTDQQRLQPGQADLLLLLVLDNANGAFRILPLNRDTMTQVNVLTRWGDHRREIRARLPQPPYGTGGLDSCRNTCAP